MMNGKKILAASGLAVAVTAVSMMSAPASTTAYTLIGGSLGTGQRDFRVWNNFTNSAANNNTTPDAQFPGQTGAVMALWKGVAEWASVPYGGTGAGDPVGGNILGDSGANFDAHFQGTLTANGGTNGNGMSFQANGSGCGGGTLAYMQGPISDGWTIRFCPSITWADGPGTIGGSQFDLQGVACHEYGHALGLGHSGSGGATMFPSIGNGQESARSTTNDDRAGAQAVYGVISGSKPQINGISGTQTIGSAITINGSNFSTSNNEVWFTNSAATGTALKVLGLSSTGGGTQIVVNVPNGAVDGSILVKKNASGNTSLSDVWPFDIGGGGPGGDPPNVTSINPSVSQTGGWTEITISGFGFAGTTDVEFGGVDVLSFNVISGSSIVAEAPPGVQFSTVDVTVTDAEGTSTLPNSLFYSFNLSPNITSVSPDEGPITGGTVVTVSGGNVVGNTGVTFDGVPGTSVQILSQTSARVTTPAGSSAGDVNVAMSGSTGAPSVIADGFTYTSDGAFVPLEPGHPGTGGIIPSLTGTGDLSPGGSGFSLNSFGIQPNASGVMFVSLAQASLPFKGGTLYTFPIALQINVQANFLGLVTIPGVIDVTIPGGSSFVLQQIFGDAGASNGISMTNGLVLQIP